jgi:hypothetical protein
VPSVRKLHASRFGRHVRRRERPALLDAYVLAPMRFVVADGGFAGLLLDWAQSILRTTLYIVRKPADQRGSP